MEVFEFLELNKLIIIVCLDFLLKIGPSKQES